MRLRKVIQERVDRQVGGLRLRGSVNAAITVNVDESGVAESSVVRHQGAAEHTDAATPGDPVDGGEDIGQGGRQ